MYESSRVQAGDLGLCVRLVLLLALSCFAIASSTGLQRPKNGTSWPGPIHHAQRHCKPIPGSPDWPSDAQWRALNSSVSGRLVSTVPLAAVCHPDWPQYNNASCAFVAAQWESTESHTLDLTSVISNEDACLPRPDGPCSGVGYPDYVINATSVADVQAGVNFARRTGVRLIIKGTGHDYLGRSVGPYSLSIYMHGIRGLEVVPGDAKATALGGVASVKIHAGEQMRNVYPFAAANNVTLVSGSDPNVGIGGWLSGGGHSPVSATYGLGADQVLELEVVTADGVFRTINQTSHPDLFWALRGGGSGNFAVLISATVKAHAPISATSYRFNFRTTRNSDTFWSMAAYFYSDMARIAEEGMMGYTWTVPDDLTQANDSIGGVIYGQYHGPNLSADRVRAIMAPLESNLTGSHWSDPVHANSSIETHPEFESWWYERTKPGDGGNNVRLGSRLLGRVGLTGDMEKLKTALRASTPPPNELIGNLVAGPGTRNPPGGVAGGNNAVLPAWRSTYVETKRTWPSLNQTAKELMTKDLRAANKALIDLEPDSGTYMNEADPTEPDWQRAFFGANYQRLLEIKSRYDPEGVFWAKAGVGSELWDTVGLYGVENGVGQTPTQLCRRSTC